MKLFDFAQNIMQLVCEFALDDKYLGLSSVLKGLLFLIDACFSECFGQPFMLLGKPQCHAQMPAQLALSSKLLTHNSKVEILSLSQLNVQGGGSSAAYLGMILSAEKQAQHSFFKRVARDVDIVLKYSAMLLLASKQSRVISRARLVVSVP